MKTLWLHIIKTCLCLIIDYVELVCIIATVVLLGSSPGVCCGLILIETQKYFSIIPVLSAVLTALSFSIVITHHKVEEIFSKCLNRIRENKRYIKELKYIKRI